MMFSNLRIKTAKLKSLKSFIVWLRKYFLISSNRMSLAKLLTNQYVSILRSSEKHILQNGKNEKAESSPWIECINEKSLKTKYIESNP